MIRVKGINDNPVGPVVNAASVMLQTDPGPRFDPQPVQPEPQTDLQSQALLAKRLGAIVEITGAWAWASWQSKPADAIRQALKDNGWLWCRNKGKWAWRSEPSHNRRAMPWTHIVAKYGLRELKQTELMEV